METNQDHYESYYSDKLWQLLPAIYRSLDSDSFDRNGPLREMVNRIGAQAAILRRSIDRLWEDQSIETCDDWVIPYIADLFATNLVSSLDARGQRIDVARTIYYRRRKGTVALLEELTSNITGWDARVVEFFHRLGRTRHGFDTVVGFSDTIDDPFGTTRLQIAKGLVGKLSRSSIGGWADLRNAYAATKANYSAFDEFFHTVDVRRGRGNFGWHNIPRLGVFLWRLYSFQLLQNDPVAVQGCPGHYVFDPTGREVPLFAAASRPFGDKWVSPEEWQLPNPISAPLLASALADPAHVPLYGAVDPDDGFTVILNSLGAFRRAGSFYNLVPPAEIVIDPERGRFKALNPPKSDRIFVTYHYGFSSTVGAGPYDRRIPKAAPTPTPGAVIPSDITGGGDSLAAPLAAVAPVGTVTIGDFLTYITVSDVAGIDQVTVMARNKVRPVIRLGPPAEWTFTGNNGSTLYLDGLLVSGADVVLKGKFDRVVVNCCTFDPGAEDKTGNLGQIFGRAADGRDLVPSTLWIEAQVETLELNRSILGPVRTRSAGEIETLSVTDSVVQAISAIGSERFDRATLRNPKLLALRLRDKTDPVTNFVRSTLTQVTKTGISELNDDNDPRSGLVDEIVQGLNSLLSGPSIFDANRFASVPLNAALAHLISLNPGGVDLVRLNRALLKAAMPAELLEIADLALFLESGTVRLSRVTLLGPAAVHRLHASECILDDIVFVNNTQDGCLRFSASSGGSILPRKYESVKISPRAQLFTSRSFGHPSYAQLVLGVDSLIVDPAMGGTIYSGAENGSEMGAFCRELGAIKERSLRIKYQEFMPLGLIPVLIYVT